MDTAIGFIIGFLLFFAQYQIGYHIARKRYSSNEQSGTLFIANDTDGVHLFVELDKPAEDIYWRGQVCFRVKRIRPSQK